MKRQQKGVIEERKGMKCNIRARDIGGRRWGEEGWDSGRNECASELGRHRKEEGGGELWNTKFIQLGYKLPKHRDPFHTH